MKIYCNVPSPCSKTYWINHTINNLWGYYTRQLNGTPLPSRECTWIPCWSICVISPRNLATSCSNSEIRRVPSLTLSNFLMKLPHKVGTSMARWRSPQRAQHMMPLCHHTKLFHLKTPPPLMKEGPCRRLSCQYHHLTSWENWTCWSQSFIFWVTIYRLYNSLGVLIPSQLKSYNISFSTENPNVDICLE